jgi:hypothetical protein
MATGAGSASRHAKKRARVPMVEPVEAPPPVRFVDREPMPVVWAEGVRSWRGARGLRPYSSTPRGLGEVAAARSFGS